MSRQPTALLLAFVGTVLLAAPAKAQLEIDGLNHYVCHKGKDSRFHSDKFPKEPTRDPGSVVALELRDAFAADFFGDVAQRFDVKRYKGVCAPTVKEKVPSGGTSGDGNVFPQIDDTLHLVDLQVKQSKKDASGNPNPAGSYVKFPKGIQKRIVTQFYDEVVELKGPALALVGADKADHGPTVKCSSEATCDAIDPALECNADSGTCLPPDPLAGLPPSPRSGPNFLCYKVKQLTKQAPVHVLAQNQFTDGVTDPDEPLLFAVSKMTRLCLPADKAGENPGAETSFDHLACYKLKQATKYPDAAKTAFTSQSGGFAPGAPPKFKGGTVAVQTLNFGQRVIDLKGASEICTPAFRSDVGSDDGIPSCGDGSVYSTAGSLYEQCDDGNTASEDGCSATCVSESCGDGITQAGLGEECDDGNTASEDGCSAACAVESCGDGITQAGLGEECDDGNDTDLDGCSASCLLEGGACGDSVVQSALGEECDDGNSADGDGCSGSCLVEFCGDGIAQPGIGEECDGGDDAACPGACNPSCACPSALQPFRLDSAEISDPPIYFGVLDLTGTANALISSTITQDVDPVDGLYDVSIVTLFRPLLGMIDLGAADCTYPAPSTCSPQNPGDPLAGFTMASYTNVFSGPCLVADPAVIGPFNNGSPTIPTNAPAAGAFGCALVGPADITLDLLGLALPLEQVEVAAEYVGSPPVALDNGLLRGFLSETTADAILLPATFPINPGQPLSSLLRASEMDTGPGGATGWWFHLNFTGDGVTWTGP